MSGQQSTNGTPCRRSKTPSSFGKHGPMKATIPISGVIKQPAKCGLSPVPGPSVSPMFLWRNRGSPDHASGQRSPGSSSYRGKLKCDTGVSEAMRRTASLDTIYLKGHWPRDNLYWQHLQVDKSTQTEEIDISCEWNVRRPISTSESDEKFSTRPKLRGNNKELCFSQISPGENTLSSSSQTFSPNILNPSLKLHSPSMVKPIPKTSIRSSVEGLNQEIEGIVLRTGIDGHPVDRYELPQITPEGHRAPLAEMLRCSRSRSVNTQTPQDFSHSSGESHGSSPDNETSKLGTSPHINRFLEREPPDGCEKVRLKSSDEKTHIMLEHAPQPSTFKFRPSLGSAFKILQPALSPSEEQSEPVPHVNE